MSANERTVRPLYRRKTFWIVLGVIVAGAWLMWPAAPPPPERSSGERMSAVVYHQYGTADVLRLEAVDKLLPRESQVLIRVRAAAANPLDWHYMRGTPYIMRLDSGFSRPKSPRLGVDVAGEVVAVGDKVTRFKPGDEVFGTAPGAFAEFARAGESKLVLKPPGISFEEAAAVPVAALTALQGLRDKGHLQPGQTVLINGASGGVGTYAVQIAKSMGAEVTGVCSTRNLELVESLGADHVVDYTREDFTRSGQTYDLILDNVGNLPLSDLRRALKPSGIAVLIGGGGPDAGHWIGPLARPIRALFYAPFVSQKFGMLMAEIKTDDLATVKSLMEEHKVRSVIDRTYPLSETPEAIRYLEQGHARGKVIITVGEPSAVPADR